jgi:hypothetical protein
MGILVPETCWGNKTAYFVASSWFFTFTMSTMHGHMNIKFCQQCCWTLSVLECHLVLLHKLAAVWDCSHRRWLPSAQHSLLSGLLQISQAALNFFRKLSFFGSTFVVPVTVDVYSVDRKCSWFKTYNVLNVVCSLLGYSPASVVLSANILEHTVCSIFTGEWVWSVTGVEDVVSIFRYSFVCLHCVVPVSLHYRLCLVTVCMKVVQSGRLVRFS